MGIGKEIYDRTNVAEVGTAVASTGVTVGGNSSPFEPFERFHRVINELEQLEQAGLISITERHQETSTGKRYIDLIRFRKLQ
jgi:hypothetical protein